MALLVKIARRLPVEQGRGMPRVARVALAVSMAASASLCGWLSGRVVVVDGGRL